MQQLKQQAVFAGRGPPLFHVGCERVSQMSGGVWDKNALRNAGKLLESAVENLHTTYPHSEASPDPSTLPAVMAMLNGAIVCIMKALPDGVTLDCYSSQLLAAEKRVA